MHSHWDPPLCRRTSKQRHNQNFWQRWENVGTASEVLAQATEIQDSGGGEESETSKTNTQGTSSTSSNLVSSTEIEGLKVDDGGGRLESRKAGQLLEGASDSQKANSKCDNDGGYVIQNAAGERR